MDIKRIVGDNIRFIRQKKGLTLEDVAVISKMSLTFISDVERCQKVASIVSIEKIAKALKVEPSILLVKDAHRNIK